MINTKNPNSITDCIPFSCNLTRLNGKNMEIIKISILCFQTKDSENVPDFEHLLVW